MAKRRDKIAKNWRDKTSKIFDKHPDWNAGQLHRELAFILGDRSVPSLNSVQKYRQKTLVPNYLAEKEKGLDNLWSFGKTLDLTADAIAAIHEVQNWASGKYLENYFEPQGADGYVVRNGITIRQALWISRLYALKVIGNDMEFLWFASYVYAVYERMCWISGEQIDTWQLDYELRKGRSDFWLLGVSILENPLENSKGYITFESAFTLAATTERVQLIEVKNERELAEIFELDLTQYTENEK